MNNKMTIFTILVLVVVLVAVFQIKRHLDKQRVPTALRGLASVPEGFQEMDAFFNKGGTYRSTGQIQDTQEQEGQYFVLGGESIRYQYVLGMERVGNKLKFDIFLTRPSTKLQYLPTFCLNNLLRLDEWETSKPEYYTFTVRIVEPSLGFRGLSSEIIFANTMADASPRLAGTPNKTFIQEVSEVIGSSEKSLDVGAFILGGEALVFFEISKKEERESNFFLRHFVQPLTEVLDKQTFVFYLVSTIGITDQTQGSCDAFDLGGGEAAVRTAMSGKPACAKKSRIGARASQIGAAIGSAFTKPPSAGMIQAILQQL